MARSLGDREERLAVELDLDRATCDAVGQRRCRIDVERDTVGELHERRRPGRHLEGDRPDIRPADAANSPPEPEADHQARGRRHHGDAPAEPAHRCTRRRLQVLSDPGAQPVQVVRSGRRGQHTQRSTHLRRKLIRARCRCVPARDLLAQTVDLGFRRAGHEAAPPIAVAAHVRLPPLESGRPARGGRVVTCNRASPEKP